MGLMAQKDYPSTIHAVLRTSTKVKIAENPEESGKKCEFCRSKIDTKKLLELGLTKEILELGKGEAEISLKKLTDEFIKANKLAKNYCFGCLKILNPGLLDKLKPNTEIKELITEKEGTS